MHKNIYFLAICSIILFFTLSGIAQTFTNFGNKPAPSSTSAGNIKIISPEQFSNQVNTLSAENHSNYKQAMDQKISQVPPPSITKNPSSSSSNSSSAAGSSPSTPPNTQQPITAAPSNAPAPQPKQPPTPAASPAAPTQVYTGFQNEQNGKTQNSGQTNNGGWNIKY